MIPPLKVLIYPHPMLKNKTKDVDHVSDFHRDLVSKMLITMSMSGNCIGLSANQVGYPISLLVVSVSGLSPLVMFNANIVTESEETETYPEGCVSLPGITSRPIRNSSITVDFLNINGQPRTKILTGLAAIAVQHEIDHLNGITMVDRENLNK
jgi:peptide deformylase